MEGQRTRRDTFDQVAALYDAARPSYPPELFDDVIALGGVPPGGRLLEIGCGTGQATLAFAQRGFRLQCVELGANLAAVARRNLAAFPAIAIAVSAFEDWPVEASAFDLAFAATAFHWIDPAIGYRKIHQALRPSGAIALCWNVHVQGAHTSDFFSVAQEVYRREAPLMAQRYTGLPGPDEVSLAPAGAIEGTGLFGPVTVRRYGWEQEYDAASYIRLLSTFSNYRSLEAPVRERLFAGLADLIERRYGGRIIKDYLSVLFVAHRR